MPFPMEFPAYIPGGREQRYCVVRFNAAATPSLATNGDPNRLLDPTTPIVDGGAGIYQLKFRKDHLWQMIDGVANLQAPAAATDRAFVDSVDEASNPRTVTVKTEVSGAIADPATSKVVSVVLVLRRVKG